MKRENEFRYSKLATILREQIMSGFVKPGQFLMSENELCKYYHMSRTSVRKSLDELLKEGLIIKRAGQGTIVAPDLKLDGEQRKVLRIIATSPSHFVDTSMPLIIEDFKKQFPNVDVKLLSFPNLNFWESVRASMEMGLKPDLVFVTDRQYHDVNQLEDFIDLREALGDALIPFYPRMLSAFSQHDKLMAVPATFSTVYLAYNPDLFQQHGVPLPTPKWSKEDFIRAARMLTLDTDGDGIIDQYGFSLTTSISRWPVIALQNQVNFRSEATSGPLVQTLSYIHDLIYRQRVVTMYQPSRYRINSDAFMRGKAAMVLTTTIEIAGWRNEEMDFEPKVAPLPFGSDKSTLLVSNAFMIPANADNPELATMFLKYLFEPSIQEKICAQSNFLSVLHPINAKLWDSVYLESLNIRDGRIFNSYFVHEVFSDPHIADELENEMELYWAGLESADDLAKRLSELISVHI